jgi:predicted component of type VI protein secretion system
MNGIDNLNRHIEQIQAQIDELKRRKLDALDPTKLEAALERYAAEKRGQQEAAQAQNAAAANIARSLAEENEQQRRRWFSFGARGDA